MKLGLMMVVQSPPLTREMNQNVDSNFPRVQLSGCLPIVWNSVVLHFFFHLWSLAQTLRRGRGPTVGSQQSFSTPSSLRKGRVAKCLCQS